MLDLKTVEEVECYVFAARNNEHLVTIGDQFVSKMPVEMHMGGMNHVDEDSHLSSVPATRLRSTRMWTIDDDENEDGEAQYEVDREAIEY